MIRSGIVLTCCFALLFAASTRAGSFDEACASLPALPLATVSTLPITIDDTIHGGDVPPTTEVLTDKSDVLYTVAEAAIEELVDHGVDALQVELILARLEDARALDRP